VLCADLRPTAIAPEVDGIRLESPRDVEFALNALLDFDSRDTGPCAAARADILGRLRPGPTVAELVDAVLAWRRAIGAGVAEEETLRRHAQRLLWSYFLIDPPMPGDAGAAS
jgi:hypothetical protein